jgi:hypothetical protein
MKGNPRKTNENLMKPSDSPSQNFGIFCHKKIKNKKTNGALQRSNTPPCLLDLYSIPVIIAPFPFFRMKMYPHIRHGDVGNAPNPERFHLLSIAQQMFNVDGLNNLQ